LTRIDTEAAAAALTGIHAATICPLAEDGSLRPDELARHVASVAAVPGMRGLLVNGHAGEGHYLTREEKRQVIRIVRENVARDIFVTAGATAESSAAAAQEAADAAEAGADAVLVFPPNAWALGHDTAMAHAHHAQVARACELPLMLYRAPVGAGQMAYSLPTLTALLEIGSVVGIKEGSWEVAAYEEVRRHTRALRPEVAVLGSGDEHLLTSYLVGTEGSQVSLAAIIPETIVALFEAARGGDWARARALHDEVYPLACAIYRAPPGYLATARLKTCLRLLGRIGSDAVRAPLRRLSAAETAALRRATGF
jgi:4-hydroxy-tetrahydrodipicolinate synthase